MSTLGFGAYVPGASPVHALNAQVKIVLACAFSVAPFFIETWVGLAVFSTLAVVLFALARVPLWRALAGLKPLLFILVFTVFVQALYGNAVWGLFLAARIALLVGSCSLLTFTTSQPALVCGLRSLLSPLRCLHVPVDDIATVVSLALRFVPVTVDEAQCVTRAHKARCAPFDAASLLARVKARVAMLAPLFVRLFRRADDLACAMDARCYRGTGRSYASGSALQLIDIVVLAIVLAALVALCVLS